MDTLYWYYAQSKTSEDIVGNIIVLIKDSGHIKSRIAVIQQLFLQDIVTSAENDCLMNYENSQYEREVKLSGIHPNDELDDASSNSQVVVQKQPDDVKVSSSFGLSIDSDCKIIFSSGSSKSFTVRGQGKIFVISSGGSH